MLIHNNQQNNDLLLNNWYQQELTNHNLRFSQEQLSIIQNLDPLIKEINQNTYFHQCKLFMKIIISIYYFWQNLYKFWPPYHNKHGNIYKINSISNHYKHYGVYLYGSVGSGKSMLLEIMFNNINLNSSNKLRLHFHEFIAYINNELSVLNFNNESNDNMFTIIAKKIKKQYLVIFLDEMLINDIATAMILKNLLLALFKEKIYLLISSNIAPDQLYLHGLMRERFLSAIDIIKQSLMILSLNTNIDYRNISKQSDQLKHTHHIIQPKLNFLSKSLTVNAAFDTINNHNNYEVNDSIEILHRNILFIQKGAKIIWFDFAIICGAMRSQLDYLALINQFDYFLLSNIHPLTDTNKDMVMRLILLVDILYDKQKRLLIYDSCELINIYKQGELSVQFMRTLSRLNYYKNLI